MTKILTSDFYNASAVDVAKELLGKVIVRKKGNSEIRLVITETEAYKGTEDLASHASKGKTERNKPMFGPPGFWYVYLVYGMHWMLNIVTGPKDYPAAVLIRSVIGLSGPARVSKKLFVSKYFDNKKSSRKTGLWVEESIIETKKSAILSGPRIGVLYAGPVWSKKKYRFYLKDSEIFRQKVLLETAKIPRGEIRSYKEIATLCGNPKSARAVGGILNKNYNPKIPCHRVIKSDKSLGGYNRGADKKFLILKKEGVKIICLNKK
jgi:DNA-3-methyladenine glycosylase